MLRPAIPGKGKILTQLTNWWFGELAGLAPNHLLATDPADFGAELRPHAALLAGRSVLARKAEVIPFECVARGFLAGSGYREYRSNGTVCGLPLPAGLVRASRLPEPIFTPATKAETGHDENVDFAHVAARARPAARRTPARPDAGALLRRRHPRRGERAHPGRHQVRVRLDRRGS